MKVYQAEKLLDERFVLGEGPCYQRDRQTLTWVDIKTGTLHGLKRDGERFSVPTGQYLGAAVPVKDQEEYLGVLTTGLYLIGKDNIRRVHSLDEEFTSWQRGNDAKCDPAGRLWFGSMSFLPGEGNQGGNLYTYTSFGGCSKKIAHTGVANGMAWSLDRKTFYFVDTAYRSVFAWDYQETSGSIRNKRIIMKFQDRIPDGMTIDGDGMLWIAFWGSYSVGRFHPESGEQTAEVQVGACQVSSCCFGGEHMDMLYITSSAEGKTGQEDGAVFQCRVDVQGIEENSFCIGAG